MIVGVFSPAINWCAGAEWVTVNIIAALKNNGHQVIILTDKSLDQIKFIRIFGKKVPVDREMVLPFRFFSQNNYHNIYTDVIRCLSLKSKCDVLIDTSSNAVLPGTDVCYFQGLPLLRQSVKSHYMINKIFFSPHKSFINSFRDKIRNTLLIANSSFSAEAIRTELNVKPHIIYPSVSNYILNIRKMDLEKQRKKMVVTVARISEAKNLHIIPYIAELTDKEISFTIIGLLDSWKTFRSLQSTIKELNLSKRVRILANTNREQLKRVLLNSRVFLHTSIDEPFGISIVEAMASGCIPIVHNSGGPKEFVPSYLRFNNINEAADILGKAVTDWSPKKAQHFSKFADRFSESNFSKQFIDIFHSHFSRVKSTT